MFLHFLVFIFPWILFAFLADKQKMKQLFITGTFASAIALLINLFEDTFNWWKFLREMNPHTDVTFFADIGLYPVEGMLLVQHLPENKKLWPFYIIGLSTFNTIGEFTLLRLKEMEYLNGWTIGWTFLSYLIPFSLVVLYSIHYNVRSH